MAQHAKSAARPKIAVMWQFLHGSLAACGHLPSPPWATATHRFLPHPVS